MILSLSLLSCRLTCFLLQAEGDDGCATFKGVGVVDATPSACFELLMDSQRKNSYDSIFDAATIIEELGEHIKVEHHLYWAPPLVAKVCSRSIEGARAEGRGRPAQ
jgi:hypothetical protein